MQFSYGLGSGVLNTLTICLRFNVEFLRPEYTTIFSYTTFISDNTLGTYLSLQSGSQISISFCKYWGKGVHKICSKKTIMESVKIHDQWHHACWSVNTEGIESDEITVLKKLFFDGKEISQGDEYKNNHIAILAQN